MDAKLKKTLLKRLESERTRLDSEIAQLRHDTKATMYLEDEPEADRNMADEASSLLERQKDTTLSQYMEMELADTMEALARMADGTYGSCHICTKPIAEKRLVARPMATTCIDCQAHSRPGEGWTRSRERPEAGIHRCRYGGRIAGRESQDRSSSGSAKGSWPATAGMIRIHLSRRAQVEKLAKELGTSWSSRAPSAGHLRILFAVSSCGCVTIRAGARWRRRT